jgi:hypothetical protein
MDYHSRGVDLPAQGRMRTHIIDHLAHARKQPRIIQYRLAYADTV